MKKGARFGANLEQRAASPEHRGFTLIELAVVLVILSVTALLVMPRLFAGDAAVLKNSARSLASTLRYLQDRAIATRSTYNLHVQFPDGTISVATAIPSGGEEAPGDPTLAGGLLGDGVSVEDVVLTTLGRVAEGEIVVGFGMSGLQEMLTVHLKSRSGGKYTVIAYPVSGKVLVEEGYRDATL